MEFVARCKFLPRLLSLLVMVCLPFLAAGKPYGLQKRGDIGPFLDGKLPDAAPAISGKWSAVVAFPHLLFTNAVGLTSVPGTDLLCVWEREGRVWLFKNSPETTEKTLAIDVHDQCQGWDDSGLLGVAFHPGFATNHFVFIYYTWVKPGAVTGSPTSRPVPNIPGVYHDRLERYTLDAHGAAVPGSLKIFVDLTDQTVWHHGGGMFFHPKNGFLYWTDGDNAVDDNNQIIDKSLYSGVFRIDVDCRGGAVSHPPPRQPLNGVTANYFIPNDNPFVGKPDALEEFFCIGLRSPHRMTIDPVTGRIFIGDVGGSLREEVDVIEPGESGLNFQWNYCEGNLGKMKMPCIGASRRPVLDYPHTEGRAVIGGYVYRGKKFSKDLGGRYIFGDNVFRLIWAMDESSTPFQKETLCVMPKGDGPNSGSDYTGLSSFGTDADGELYFCQMSSIGGRIYQLQRGGPPPPKTAMPELLSQTGLFIDLPKLEPADYLIPYTVNSPLWSDGAVKNRWMALSRREKISFHANGEWEFPSGTVFVKTFSLPVDDSDPSVLRRLETRLLVRDTNGGVYGATYRWRRDDSDADLIANGTNELITIRTAGGTRKQNWYYPGRQDCLTCHTAPAGGVLGPKTRQLNGDFQYPNGIIDNQLRSWSHLGLFDTKLRGHAIAGMPRLVAVTNAHAPLELRVRSYLDANCSLCHRPGGVEAFFDARYDTPLKSQSIINGPLADQMDIAGARVVVPRDLQKSVMLRRLTAVGGSQMPPLARNVVDTNAAAVFSNWISSLAVEVISLPRGWNDMDVGETGLPGEATFVSGRFNVLASGSDIWGNADSFHFAYKTLVGDGQIIARLAKFQYTDPWAKAGVMLRENISAGSKYVFVGLTDQGGAVMQSREAPDDSSANAMGPDARLPVWLKLVRGGNGFDGYVSTNAVKWNFIGHATIRMNKNILAGLAVTSHKNTMVNSTLFENVRISP